METVLALDVTNRSASCRNAPRDTVDYATLRSI